MKYTEGLFEFIKSSPEAYHAINTVRERLDSLGYTELFEGENWNITDVCTNPVEKNG